MLQSAVGKKKMAGTVCIIFVGINVFRMSRYGENRNSP